MKILIPYIYFKKKYEKKNEGEKKTKASTNIMWLKFQHLQSRVLYQDRDYYSYYLPPQKALRKCLKHSVDIQVFIKC